MVLGACEHCNYVKEAPSWQVSTGEGKRHPHRPIRPPTGAGYRSTVPPLPGAPMITISEVDIKIGIVLADLHAA